VRATEKEERKKEKGREEEEKMIRFYCVYGAKIQGVMLGAKIHGAPCHVSATTAGSWRQ
jgi:hypothetical protein